MAKGPHILICDDDPVVHESLSLYFDNEGFKHSSAYNGSEAIEHFHSDNPDLIVLDMMMPEMNGVDVCREIRRMSNVPIIMLTAKSEEIDKVVCLEIGADDYITKPFSVREVVARIKAVLRRITETPVTSSDCLKLPDLELTPFNYQVKVRGEVVPFTPKEFEILYMLASNPGKVISREDIMQKIWGYNYEGDLRTIDTHVKRIRQKINVDNAKWALSTVYGLSYKFETVGKV